MFLKSYKRVPELECGLRAYFGFYNAERLIRTCANPGDLVIDPMCVTGTTPTVANKVGRRWLGIEHSEEYAAAGRDRHLRREQAT